MASDSSKNGLFIYRLTFGNIIAYKGTQPGKLQLEQGVRKELSDGTRTFYLMLHGVKVNRKIYQPIEIEAELDIMQATTGDSTTVPKVGEIRDLLLQRQVDVDILEVDRFFDATRTPEYTNSYSIAKNCYVYELNPQLNRDVNGVKMYVKLNIFSMDKLMTLNKYSKAYVARKLGSEILKPESLQFFGEVPDDKAEGVPLIDSDIDSQQHLMYTDGGNQHEFIQPYLVQYNESFYDFLVRTSNRCGEFLFFENGKLILGLPEKTALGLTDSDTLVEVKDYDTVTTQEKSIDPLIISAYARDSVKSGEGKDLTLNQSAIKDKDEDGGKESPYPDGVFPKEVSSNAEFVSDDYIFPLFKDKFSSVARELLYDGNGHQISMAHLIPFFKNMLANETPGMVAGIGGSLAKALIVGEGIQAGLAVLSKNSKNSAGNKTFIEPYKDKPEQHNEKEVVQFAALVESSWTTLEYYNDIHRKEASVQRQIVCINMGTSFIDVKLGQKITIPGMEGTYIVIQIRQVSEEAWNHDYDKYGDDDSNDRYMGQRSLKIYAIPAYKDSEKESAKEEYYPPVHPVPIIRKADPQTAFVADNVDPKYQGRVRIAFPWQSLGKAERDELNQVNKSLHALKEDIQKLEEREEALSKRKNEISELIEQLKKYVNASDEERKKMFGDKKAQLITLEESLSMKEMERERESNQLAALDQKNELTPDEQMTQGILQTDIPKLDKDIRDKNTQIDKIQEAMAAFVEAAKEHDEKKGKADYTNLYKDNSVISRYHTTYHKVIQQYNEVNSDLLVARGEKKEKEEKRDQLASYVDKCVKDMSTPWVRVVSPMATPGGGTFFRPRVGDEVLVNFENGNVERPYVMGSLYSKNVLTPDERLYRRAAPDLQWKDISMSMMSPNGHHITFTDPPGGGSFISNLISPGIGFYAACLPYLSTLNSMGKEFKDLNGGIHIGDRYGLYEIDMRSNKRTIDIKSPFGTVNINAFSGITISAPNGDVKIKGKNITFEAGNKITMLSGKNIAEPGIGDPEGKLNKAGAKVTGIIGAVLSGGVAPQFIESVVDLSLVRHVVETFVRPVDGTMLLKSKRYLRVEAGKGNATIRRDRYASALAEKKESQEEFFKAMLICVKFISEKVDGFYDTYEALWLDGYKKRTEYEEKGGWVLKDIKNPKVVEKVSNASEWNPSDIDLDFFNDHFSEVGILFNSGKNHQTVTKNPILKFDYLKDSARAYAESAFKIYKHINHFSTMLDDSENLALGDFKWLSQCFASIIDAVDDKTIWAKGWAHVFKNGNEYQLFNSSVPNPSADRFAMSNKKIFKRKLLLSFIDHVSKDFHNALGKYITSKLNMDKVMQTNSLRQEYYWNRTVLNFDNQYQNNFLRTLLDNTVGKLKAKFKDNFRSFDQDIWNDKADGQILFSDHENTTLNFQGEGLHEESSSNIGTLDHLKKELMAMK